jgi:hypothetical protein
MSRLLLCVTLVIVFAAAARTATRVEQEALPHSALRSAARADDVAILVRPGTLASQIGDLAGHTVRVPYARVVGVFNPRVFLIDSAMRMPPIPGNRGRVLVFVEPGTLSVSPKMIVASTVTVFGVARTLLGMQASREVPWPVEVPPEAVERLEIRAAVLASSVRTPDGVELIRRNEPLP